MIHILIIYQSTYVKIVFRQIIKHIVKNVFVSMPVKNKVNFKIKIWIRRNVVLKLKVSSVNGFPSYRRNWGKLLVYF